MNIGESIEAIFRREKVVTDLFYTIFLDRYPDVRVFFEGVDLNQQAIMLKMALMMIEQHFRHRFPGAEQYLRVLGHRHSLRGIPHDLYPQWRDCLLETLRRFHGSDWHEELQREWHEAVDLAAEVMIAGYESPEFY